MAEASLTETLQISMPTDRELVMTRVLNAGRSLVFDALTQPKMLKQWYGASGWSLLVCEVDLKVGGAWRFVTRRPDGREIGQCGVYREIVAPERIVNTESWEDWNPGEVQVTTVLIEQEGRTIFTSTLLFLSREVRDMLVKSGMTNEASNAYDKLADYLKCAASVAANRELEAALERQRHSSQAI